MKDIKELGKEINKLTKEIKKEISNKENMKIKKKTRGYNEK